MSFNILKENHFQEFAKEAKEEIKNTYLNDNRPWVVGYSGGKDSTAVVQLVFEALSELPREQVNKKVYVISSDTLVETPLIISSINKTLRRIQEKALELDLPFETHKVKPDIESTFWTSIIGKGYPSPRQKFRWCTDRMKINPANRFIKDKVSKFGEVIMVLGVREKESQTRADVIKSHTTDGKVLMRHSTLPNAYVYAPIRKFNLDNVWDYLLNNISPWGDDNHELLSLYQSSNSECPLIVDKEIKESAGSCGNSRFGCWTCTVVTKDKALAGFIDNGEEWLKPLLEFRNWLSEIRDVREYRQKTRMNGQMYFISIDIGQIDKNTYTFIKEKDLGNYLRDHHIDLSNVEDLNLIIEVEDGGYKQLGLGPFTLNAREMILRRLLETQKLVQNPYDKHFQLIRTEELKMIRKYWLEDGDWKDRLPVIYKEISGEDLDWEYDDRPLFEEDQITDLESLCREENVDLNLLKKLISIEKTYAGYKVRRGVIDNFKKTLNQEYLHL
ncbi:DNA phosphorothioation system sulfurtransferase DndC [Bacillus haynesii]|uniref:DNA phosphorothioation system sulfurtransferase DndC n=1 Tax=Bacillus haynesii TaxID=1925021 RepID=UPI002DB7A9B6|nr:DNA phosphorothioation system sulfurtransferase DndC [Bacillus haynesii]MEC1344651.1 DNA phosphorothioation system sulfurtransferase DndC [Bacillus haynesii]